MTYTQQIIAEINNGIQFQNETSGWFTLINLKAERFMICFRDGEEYEYKTYQSIETIAKRIIELNNRG